jgi:hypothetical protein
MIFNKFAVFFCLCITVLVACSDSGSDPVDPGGPPQIPPDDMQTTWTVVGTIELPANEAATNLKVWATEGVIQTQLVSDVVLLAPTGSPPMANFQLNIDVGMVATDTRTIVDLYVYQDVNDNNNLDAGELSRLLMPTDPSCSVWGNGTSKSRLATFSYRLAGSTNTPVTSWYYPNCSQENDCLNRVTTSNLLLTGAKLSYSLANNTPIQP